MNNNAAPTERFANRVAEYRLHRPDYPPQIIDILKREKVIHSTSIVADIGAGTGLSSLLFLPHVGRVYGVEPNNAMRRQAEIDLGAHSNFFPIDGSAEATTLAESSIDLIVAAQAFHWFKAPAAQQEFRRILKPPGYALLMWNERDIEGDALQGEYEALLQKWIANYHELAHKSLTEATITEFFAVAPRSFSLPNHQTLTLDALKGRMLSSSYIPKPPSPIYNALMAGIKELFDRHETGGAVRFVYRTKCRLGTIF